MFWGEPSWNHSILCMKFYVVLQNSNTIDDGLHLYCFLELKAINSPEKCFPDFIQNWKTSTFLKHYLSSLVCLSNHLISADFLPSFFSSLCVGQSRVPDPHGLSLRRSPLLYKEWNIFLLQLCKWTHWGRWGLPVPTSPKALVTS